VWYFLSSLRTVPTGHDRVGVTWLELLAKFEHDGGCLDKDICTPTGIVKPTLRRTLKVFKSMVLHTIRTCGNDHASLQFAACRVNTRRLGGLGFSKFTSAVSMLPCWQGVIPLRVVCYLLTLRMRVTRATPGMINHGTLFVRHAPLALKGVPRWRNQVGDKTRIPNALPAAREKHAQIFVSPGHAHNVHAVAKPSFWLACPACNFWRDVGHIDLLANKKWASIRCGQCKGPRSASKWLCPCKRRWNLCPMHVQAGFECHRPQRLAHEVTRHEPPRPKRQLQLDDEGYPTDPPIGPKRCASNLSVETLPAHVEVLTKHSQVFSASTAFHRYCKRDALEAFDDHPASLYRGEAGVTPCRIKTTHTASSAVGRPGRKRKISASQVRCDELAAVQRLRDLRKIVFGAKMGPRGSPLSPP
jgi:hypothetical protein